MSPLRIDLNTKPSWLMRGSRVGTGGPDPPPLKNHKNKGFLSNTGPDPLKIEKLPSQHSMLGHHRPAPISETPCKWRFAGGPMIARFNCYWDSLSPHKKTLSEFWQNFLDPRMVVAYIDDAQEGPRIVHEDWQPIDFLTISVVAVSVRGLGILHCKMMVDRLAI